MSGLALHEPIQHLPRKTCHLSGEEGTVVSGERRRCAEMTRRCNTIQDVNVHRSDSSHHFDTA